MSDSTGEVGAFRRRWRAQSEGVLLVAGRVEPVRFVHDPGTGRPVMPVPGDALRSDEPLTLLTPDEQDDALQLLGEPEAVDPRADGACDRHRAWFGEPEHGAWMRLRVECVKRLDEVVDAEGVVMPNPLRAFEGALCRVLNADPAALGRACVGRAGAAIERPMAVGVDPHGVFVRARFGVVRVEFASEAGDEAGARAEIAALLGAG